MPTRFPSGFNNADSMSTLSNADVPDPSKNYIVFDDFTSLSATDWLVVETQAGATQAVGPGMGGRVVLTNVGGAIGDVNALTTPVASFRITLGKKFFAKMRASVSDVTNTILHMGFEVASATLLPANGVYVTKTGTAVTVTNANASALTSATFTDPSVLLLNQFCTLGLEYDGKSVNLYYGSESLTAPLPDRKVASIDAPNFNTAVDVLFVVGIKNVNAAANVGNIDYALAVMER